MRTSYAIRLGITLTLCGCANNAVRPLKLNIDASAAIALAENTLAQKYGRKEMEQQMPFRAELQETVWVVYGSPPPLPKGEMYLGGVDQVRISAKTGRVLKIVRGY